MRFYLFFSFLIFSLSTVSVAQNIPGLTFGGDKNEQGFSFSITNDNGYILTGSTKSFGSGSRDIYLVKIDAFGFVEWSGTYGIIYQDHGMWVEQTSDNGYIITGYRWGWGLGREDVILLKTDQYGNEAWLKNYGGNHRDQGFCVKVLQDGFVVAGHSKSVDPKGDMYVFKTDFHGNELWSSSFGTEYIDYGYSIIPAEDGHFLVVGAMAGFYNVELTAFKRPDADMLLVKLNETGGVVWQKTYGGASHDWGWSIINAPDGGYYCFGSTQSYGNGSFDAWLLKIDNEGNEQWNKTYGGSDFEYGTSIDIGEDGNLYLLGTTRSFGAKNLPDLYLMKTNPQGEVIWSLTIGGDYSDYGHSVKATADGGCAMLGNLEKSDESIDMYFVKVDSMGGFELFGNLDDLQIKDNTVFLFPNPIIDFATFLVNDSNAFKGFDLLIFSNNGQLVRAVHDICAPQYLFKREQLPAGAYVYQINLHDPPNTTYAGQFIVK